MRFRDLQTKPPRALKGFGELYRDGTYTFEKGAKPKTFDIYAVQDGLPGLAKMGADFEKAARSGDRGGRDLYR